MSTFAGGSIVTRGATEHFMIGHHQSSLDSGGKLPVLRKILQYLKYLQSLPGKQNRPVKSVISCPLITNLKIADCNGSDGCGSGEDLCVVSALSKYWIKAGIPRISDYAISVKVLKLFDEWKSILKNRNKSTPVEIAKRKEFAVKLDQLLDIATSDAIQVLKSDRLRSAEARQADIDFYVDQKGPRIGYMARLDEIHRDTIEKRKKRKDEERRRQLKNVEVTIPFTENLENEDFIDNEETENIADEEDEYVVPATRTKKPSVIPLLVPRNIAETVALNSKRFKINDAAPLPVT